jgi:N-acetylneuraminic acid mutarotase
MSNSTWLNVSQHFDISIREVNMHRAITHNENIYIFFGDSGKTVFQINIPTMQVIHHEIDAPPRTFYTINAYKDKFYLFGGHMSDNFYNNDMMIFDPRNMTDYSRPKQDIRPTARRYHVSANVGDQMYMFGGEYSWDVHLNDLWKMDFDTLEWTRLYPNGITPSPRRYHTMIEYKEALYVFGGRDEKIRMNSLSCYDPYLNSWKTLTGIDTPLPRAGHSAVRWKNSMFLFGGNDGDDGKLRGDILEYRFDKNDWKIVDVTGVKPRGRYWHAAVVTHDGDMYIQGGRADTNSPEFLDLWKISLGETRSLPISIFKKRNDYIDVVFI